MTEKDKQAVIKFFREELKTAESMVIVSMQGGNMKYAIAASPSEISYMTDVLKHAITNGSGFDQGLN